MAERTGFEPVEERLVLHRFSKPAHSTTLPSLLKFINKGIPTIGQKIVVVTPQACHNFFMGKNE